MDRIEQAVRTREQNVVTSSAAFETAGRSQTGAQQAVSPARLAFQSVGHSYGGAAVLTDVTLSVAPGEILCLLGPSGCGKTTLLRLAAGVEAQTEGVILLDGHEVAGPQGFVPAEERGLGLVFQDYALFPHLTVLDNVLFGIRRGNRPAAMDLAQRTLERMGLTRYADAYPNALSGGEQQRVALVRALMPRPRVLLMDEPFSGLDRTLRHHVRRDALALLRETASTAVVVTHDPEEAMQIGDRIALMRAGRVVQEGDPASLYARPVDLEAARFFSEVNEFETTIRDGCAMTPLGQISVPDMKDGAHVVVVARPDALLPAADGRGCPGRVVDRRFLGEIERIEVEVEGFPQLLVVRRPVRCGGLAGDTVTLALDPEATLVFPSDPDRAGGATGD
ncbi:ABC transporter ATP-binding protein [Amorphus orientalis]|uniref:Iron(III) transport system ATP-binding protein n=1 Tax=Amorphus orientalis TaxID=649198 RepID=A0AAE3VQ50_9HYPH|nr:ABC transporter ATP-binding protein [Amorphus orientalis]MDQ0316234.1 iron(III) transport system ATP-binding protein [Amorphus orientalis]